MSNKITQEGRIALFHIFKMHKKDHQECTPCKHIKFFLMYEAKSKQPPIGFDSGIGIKTTITPSIYLNPETIKVKDEWVVNSNTVSPPIGGLTDTYTTTKTIAPTPYNFGSYGKGFTNHKEIILVFTTEQSITHIKDESSFTNMITGKFTSKFSTCTTKFKEPFPHQVWKSYLHLCECGERIIKWVK